MRKTVSWGKENKSFKLLEGVAQFPVAQLRRVDTNFTLYVVLEIEATFTVVLIGVFC